MFTSHGGLPFWWRDETGITHACEGAEIYAGSLAYWTLCQLDVPVREPVHPGPKEKLTCRACLAVIRDRKGRDDQAQRDLNQRDTAPPRPH